MKAVDKILATIQESIETGVFLDVETDKVEIKDLSSGDNWKELYKSVCAFLNTEGGIIIVGINEKEKKYRLTGVDPLINEAKLKAICTAFKDFKGQETDLAEYFPPMEIKDFPTIQSSPIKHHRVCVIYVEKLPEDKKFAFYEGVAYRRNITGDHRIKKEDIEAQEERKIDLAYAKELDIVQQAELSDLDIDKLNDYIIRLNRDVKIESLKADINSAASFLHRKFFCRDKKPTLLGMLVCGNNIYDFIESRCQVDAYVDSATQVAQDKQIIKDNIFSLMERSVGFVYKNIQVGVAYNKGGAELPEYPEKLIRETINNALAHRDYSVNRFVNIIIKPNQSIEVRNPGSFRQEQRLVYDEKIESSIIRIRRIIPVPKARNPKLADILKTFDRWEGRGTGMASLTNACLDNQIDVPYYLLHSESDISLHIPKGKVLDAEMLLWLESFSGYLFDKCQGSPLTDEEKIVLAYFYKTEKLNKLERYTVLLTPDNNHFSVISSLEDKNLIFRTTLSQSEYPLYPVYIVDRVLTQDSFRQELRHIFGTDFDLLKVEYQEILEVIYRYQVFSLHKSANANLVGDFIYRKRNKVISETNKYENYKRNVRNIFNKLTNSGFIEKSETIRYGFILNQKNKQPSLFEQKKAD
jgi:predicted HTH transcriptional regulator